MSDDYWGYEDNLVSGDGSNADMLNEWGDNYFYNQSPYDAIDNGVATQGTGSTSTSSPGWLSSLWSGLGSAAEMAGKLAPTVASFTGSTTKPNAAVAQPGAGAPGATQRSFSTSYILAAVGVGLAVLVGLFFALRRR